MMVLAEFVARHVSDDRRPSTAIVVRSSADLTALGLTGAPVHTWDEHLPEEAQSRTVVEVLEPGQEEEQVAALAAVLTDTEVAILLFSQPPELLPVGVVAGTLSRHHLTVLDASGTSHRLGRTTLAVSRDAERRQRAYLTGNEIPDNDASRLRQRNEWLVEGLQARARLQLLERRLAGQDAELALARQEHRELEQELMESGELSARLKVEQEELSTTRDALAATESALATSEKALAASERSLVVARRATAVRPSTPSAIRKAAHLLAEDPVKGSGRVVRAVARRLRR